MVYLLLAKLIKAFFDSIQLYFKVEVILPLIAAFSAKIYAAMSFQNLTIISFSSSRTSLSPSLCILSLGTLSQKEEIQDFLLTNSIILLLPLLGAWKRPMLEKRNQLSSLLTYLLIASSSVKNLSFKAELLQSKLGLNLLFLEF